MSNASSPPEPSRSSGRNLGTIVIVAGIVVAIIIGFVAIASFGGDGSGSAGKPSPTTPSVTVTPPTSPGPTLSPPTAPPSLNCTPAPPLPKAPQQFKNPPSPDLAEDAVWKVTLETNCGAIVMELDGKAAPQTVASFLFLSQHKYFDNVPCHRLTTPEQGLSVLQCGDPTGTGSGGPGYGYGVENAPPDGKYPTGTVAMARTSDPNSNGSQFFIVYGDTTLNDPTGYSIFGKVVQGIDIVQAVAAKGLAADGTAPAQPISILSVSFKKL
jgi:peptidyl-prolyl cis-trans isomerase B (cyclophilin B)